MAPPALLQVFRNLTSNAIQAMTTGGTLRLSTRRDPNHSRVTAIVADTGAGIPPEVIGHLFEPFFTTKPEGTGLGLAIAREIALAHRGDLRAANRTDGTGAVFTLTLPAYAPGNNGEARLWTRSPRSLLPTTTARSAATSSSCWNPKATAPSRPPTAMRRSD